MNGYLTTFLALFDDSVGGRPEIKEIEIPIIQRDFAQGRVDEDTSALRNRFLDKIVRAVTTDENMGLDFIYGDVRDGVLQPLDGQQRLTTLFLLHWYVASRAGVLDPASRWLRFSYATRPTARDFTQTVGEHSFPGEGMSPSEWITDQPWYLYTWRHDPSISSMLVILDAIHSRMHHRDDFGALWARLDRRTADVRDSAIWFLFLPIIDIEHGEDLYIKMNSRGKPLTTFEVFKADFESIVKAADPDRYQHLIDSIDGPWADLLWQYEKRGRGDFKLDDEFERYLTFIIEISEWRDGEPDRKWHDKASKRLWPLEERARLAFADSDNEHSPRNRDFFFHAFDTWIGHDPTAQTSVVVDPRVELSKIFVAGEAGEGALPLFSSSADLFGACISRYGDDFSAQETLMLFAVLLIRQVDGRIPSEVVARRLRSLRNVSAAFLELNRMAGYVVATEQLILDGILDPAGAFRSDWVNDEVYKWSLLEDCPDLEEPIHQIEDHNLIRGRIMAFDLDVPPSTLSSRVEAFAQISHAELRDVFGATLLTKGDYSREIGWQGEKRQLGSSVKDDSWTDMLTTGSREGLANMREPLALLLDDVAGCSAGEADARHTLEGIRSAWLDEQESSKSFDWRYYLVRYSGARSAEGDGYYHGTYFPDDGGFDYGSLRILHGSGYNSYFSDALLRAAWVEGGLADIAEKPTWFRDYERGLTLIKSRVEIQCLDDSFRVLLPDSDDIDDETFDGALKTFTTERREGDELHIPVAQDDETSIDAEDRVNLGIRLVRALAERGF